MSDLIVIGYPDEVAAYNVWDELVKLQRDYLVDLEDAAIIRRDQKGKFHITTPAHHAVAWGTVSGLFWGTLIGLLFLFSGTFFPITQLPAWIRPIAYATPLWHGVALCRALSLGTVDVAAALGHVGYLIAIAALGLAWGQRTYRRRLHV